MELKNKTVLFLGDSITEGAGTTAPEFNYVSVFSRLSGANVVNYGIGGTRIARQTVKSNERWDQDFVSRVDDMQKDADAVVVFGGTNDFGHGDAKIGAFDSRDVYTFYGAMHVLCRKLIEKYPDAVIVFMTPLHRLSEDSMTKEFGAPEEKNLAGYVDIIKEVAGFYGLPVLDLFHTSGLQPKVDIIREKFMPDGLHPSNAGAEKLARRVYGFLSTL